MSPRGVELLDGVVLQLDVKKLLKADSELQATKPADRQVVPRGGLHATDRRYRLA